MKILNSFVVDDGEKKTKVELLQLRLRYPFPKRFCYVLVHNSSIHGFLKPYFTKFFAKRRFDKVKRGYKSYWLTYGVYDEK